MLSQIQPDSQETHNTVSKTPTQRKNKNSVQTDFSELPIMGKLVFCISQKWSTSGFIFCYTNTVFNERLGEVRK